ncbi:MAG: DUF4476 domain-containing protein [Microscillaceae bacterium]|nr:DUF4476 domain-containing protein [Microscillaceae bacterium]MDW8461335.1 DUF4476 domain-containing protein [Cytophagales bacterium]
MPRKFVRIILLLTLYYQYSLLAQVSSPCNMPLNHFAFEQKRREIANQPNAIQQLRLAKQLVRTNCLTANQVKEIALLFQDDLSRLDFAKEAYHTVFDKQNFYEVYNSFLYFSNVFILHDYVQMQRGSAVSPLPTPTTPNSPVPTLNFPALNYPNYFSYSGNRNCSTPLSESEFMLLAQPIATLNGDNARITAINRSLNQYCWAVSQLMRLATLLDLEINRLNLLKQAYVRCFDIDNYNQAVQVFSNTIHQQDLQNFIRQQQNLYNLNPNNHPLNCSVSASDFAQMISTLNEQSFENTRVNMMKQLFSTYKCFTIAQIAEFMKILSFDDNRLEVAKAGYDFCIEKKNYFMLANSLVYSDNRNKLIIFLSEKK